MASTPLASPSRRYHPTSSPFFDSPGDSSNCSVIFGAGGSPSPSKANILTPISRRETLILPQGFAGRGKSLLVDSPSATTNNSELHLLLNSSSPSRGRSSSPTKGRFLSPLVPQQATPRSTRSSASSSNSSPDKENPTPRRSSRRKAASSTSTLDDLSTASPSRSLRFSSTPKSARRAKSTSATVEEPSTPVHGEQEHQPAMLNESVTLAAEDDTEEQMDGEARAVYLELEVVLQEGDLQEEVPESQDSTDPSSSTFTDSPSTDTLPLPPATLLVRDALSYDSDELTDTDAEGSYEIFSDDEVDQNAEMNDDEDVQDVLSQLQELRVESAAPSPSAFVEDEQQEEELVEVEEQDERDSKSENVELEESSDLEAVETAVEEDDDELEAEVDQAQVEDALVEDSDVAIPSPGTSEEFEEEELGGQLVDEQPLQVEEASEKETDSDHQRVLEEQLRPPSPFVSSAPLDSPPAASPIRTSLALPLDDPTIATPRTIPSKAAPTPLVAAVTPVRPPSATPSRAAKASSTPSATAAKRQPVLAAPTARRQLTKLTSKPAVRPAVSTADAGRVLSGIVPSSAAPGQRRLGMTKSTLPVRSSPPPSSTLSRATGIPKSTAPLPSSSLSSASALPTPSSCIARSKLAAPLKSSAAPSKLAPPSSTASRTLAPTRMMAPAARRTAPGVDGRPGSATSNSSGASTSTSTLPRPRTAVATKSLKPPSAASATTSTSLARPAAVAGVARRGLAPPTSASARAGITPSPRPPSSTSALASRPPPPSTAASQPTSAPTGLLPRPPPGPPSALPSTRLLPSLAPTHSAPSVLSSEARPAPSPAPSPLPAQPTLPLLPRPAPLNPTPRSPEKRSAQRVVRDVPADRLTKSDSENVPPRQLTANGSSSSLASQSVVPKLHRTALGATASLPNTSTLPPVSPVKSARTTFVAPPHPATIKIEQPSLLTAAPEKVDAEVVSGLFGAPPAQELLSAPMRSTRARRTKVTTEVVEPEPAPAPVVEPLLPRPTRRARTVVAEVVAESPSDEPSPEAAPPAIVRPPITFNPAPALTQEELNRLTQKNTKRNQLHFNKHDVQTIILDVNRPPSPTSKIRRSISKEGAAGRPTTKEGREARAANRRRALRSSTDGSELELMKNELGAAGGEQEEQKGPVVHYRAPGDEEEFFSPVRTTKVLKGRKKDSTTTELVLKTVKWDKLLVYEGPVNGESSRAEGIIKRIPLDAFGNSTNTATGFAKPAPVQIKKLVYKDDE
ncbi:hypothetical protein BCR35DRAFT_165221 [Leucosporidium creatinivorum]|uniref:Uncharacterized protein n=1 Tax=Leucosporidium creatinivorum TaxID=106004 RepID=A0A1Y2EL16_9BASI|nr:hypothetical protein BCR35DRAFT_165221 [Leucosporidium creatinivorum]